MTRDLAFEINAWLTANGPATATEIRLCVRARQGDVVEALAGFPRVETPEGGNHRATYFGASRAVPQRDIAVSERGLGIEKTRVALALAETHTAAEIAHILGVTRTSVYRALAANEVAALTDAVDYELRSWRIAVRMVMDETVRTTRFGYRRLYLPMHPAADVRGEVAEHRVIAERKLARFLRPDELVHHVNEVRADNRPENLEVMSIGEHQRIHAARRLGPDRVAAGSQVARVLDALRGLGGVATATEIHRVAGTMRLNSRIAELRKRGHIITCRHLPGRGGPDAYEYTLHERAAEAEAA